MQCFIEFLICRAGYFHFRPMSAVKSWSSSGGFIRGPCCWNICTTGHRRPMWWIIHSRPNDEDWGQLSHFDMLMIFSPLVNVYIVYMTMERSTIVVMEKSTLNGIFNSELYVYQRLFYFVAHDSPSHQSPWMVHESTRKWENSSPIRRTLEIIRKAGLQPFSICKWKDARWMSKNYS